MTDHEADVNPTPDPPQPVPPPAPVISDGLTKEMSDANAKAIYPQTVQRISTLMQTVIQLTGNGDLAIWAVMESLGATIRGLNFASVPHLSRQQFLGCAELVLTAYATRMADYRRAWDDYETTFALTTKAGTPAPELPELPTWTDADTLAIYAQMDALYGPPKGDA